MAKINQPPSIYAFVEQTARMLRDAVQLPSKKKRAYSKKTKLSTTNKIEQVASMLRNQAKKKRGRKKKK